jgi:hypothetical protein
MFFRAPKEKNSIYNDEISSPFIWDGLPKYEKPLLVWLGKGDLVKAE